MFSVYFIAAIVITTYSWVRFCDWVVAPWLEGRAECEGDPSLETSQWPRDARVSGRPGHRRSLRPRGHGLLQPHAAFWAPLVAHPRLLQPGRKTP